MVFGVPYDDYHTEVKISLKEGEAHTLEFQPVYAAGRREISDLLTRHQEECGFF